MQARVLIIGLSAVFAGGCEGRLVDLGVEGVSIKCDSSSDCPPNKVCELGLCQIGTRGEREEVGAGGGADEEPPNEGGDEGASDFAPGEGEAVGEEGEGERPGEGEGEGEGEASPEGPGSLGEECFPNETCLPGLACRAALCFAAGGLGEGCFDGDVCDPGLACVQAVCVPGGGDGRPCIDGGCDAGLACVESACEAGGAEEQPCLPEAQGVCDDGLRCTEAACVPALGLEGEPCFANETCEDPFLSVFAQCRDLGGEGSPCEVSEHCQLGLECADSGECALPEAFADCAAGCAAVAEQCNAETGGLCGVLCQEDQDVLACLSAVVGDACGMAEIWPCLAPDCAALCDCLENDAEPDQGCDRGHGQCLSDCAREPDAEGMADLAGCLVVAIGDECLDDALEECAEERCEGGAVVCDPSNGLFCFEHGDFVRCDRQGNFGYAACIDGTCTALACGRFSCNPGRQHFPPPLGGDRFTVLEGGLVVDAVTNLMWEQASEGGLTNIFADDRCSASQLGGYDDWRLPDFFELFSLVDHTPFGGTLIDVVTFPATPAGLFWTTSGVSGDADGNERWYVNFRDGVVRRDWFPEERTARCVRVP